MYTKRDFILYNLYENDYLNELCQYAAICGFYRFQINEFQICFANISAAKLWKPQSLTW